MRCEARIGKADSGKAVHAHVRVEVLEQSLREEDQANGQTYGENGARIPRRLDQLLPPALRCSARHAGRSHKLPLFQRPGMRNMAIPNARMIIATTRRNMWEGIFRSSRQPRRVPTTTPAVISPITGHSPATCLPCVAA